MGCEAELRAERKAAFLEFKQHNPECTIQILAEATGRTEHEVEGFLYTANRFPAYSDIYALTIFGYVGGYKMPRSIDRIKSRLDAVATRAGKKYNTGVAAETIGDRVISHGKEKYIYRGELRTKREIEALRSMSWSTIHNRISSFKPGDDVTAVVDEVKVRGRKKKGD